jgi:hypothetical protein
MIPEAGRAQLLEACRHKQLPGCPIHASSFQPAIPVPFPVPPYEGQKAGQK